MSTAGVLDPSSAGQSAQSASVNNIVEVLYGGDDPKKTLNIPVFAICDSNVDPTIVDYPIPANDDAIKSVKLILDYFVAAIKDGKAKTAKN